MNMQERVYEFDIADADKMKKLLLYDPYLDKSLDNAALGRIKEDKLANVIFARQNCVLKDGFAIGLDGKKAYLYIKANEEFFPLAEEKLKFEIKSLRPAAEKERERVCNAINEEESRSNQGVGLIFG